MLLEQLKKGQTLRINKSYHVGRTYKVVGFDADKFGNRYAVCEWIEERGRRSSFLIYPSELN